MKVEVEISNKEIVEATQRAFKKAIVDMVLSGGIRNGKYGSKLEAVIDEVLPDIIKQNLDSLDLKAMVDTAVENKAKRLVSKMVNK